MANTGLTHKIVELNDDQLRNAAPSIFAKEPFKGASDRYSFIPTIEAINHLRDAGWKPVQAGQSNVRDAERDGYQKHMVRFSKQDLVDPERRLDAIIYNSHDVSATWKMLGGIYEFVCSNGMVIGDDMIEFIHKHQGFSIDDFIEDAGKLDRQLVGSADMIEDWKNAMLEEPDRITIARVATDIIYPAATFEPESLLTIRRKEDEVPSLWKTINVIQENMIQGGIEGKSSNNRKTVTKQITSLDRDREINQSLWQIADNAFHQLAA